MFSRKISRLNGFISGCFGRLSESLDLQTTNDLEIFHESYKVGPLPVINGVITPISRVITPVTQL